MTDDKPITCSLRIPVWEWNYSWPISRAAQPGRRLTTLGSLRSLNINNDSFRSIHRYAFKKKFENISINSSKWVYKWNKKKLLQRKIKSVLRQETIQHTLQHLHDEGVKPPHLKTSPLFFICLSVCFSLCLWGLPSIFLLSSAITKRTSFN